MVSPPPLVGSQSRLLRPIERRQPPIRVSHGRQGQHVGRRRGSVLCRPGGPLPRALPPRGSAAEGSAAPGVRCRGLCRPGGPLPRALPPRGSAAEGRRGHGKPSPVSLPVVRPRPAREASPPPGEDPPSSVRLIVSEPSPSHLRALGPLHCPLSISLSSRLRPVIWSCHGARLAPPRPDRSSACRDRTTPRLVAAEAAQTGVSARREAACYAAEASRGAAGVVLMAALVAHSRRAARAAAAARVTGHTLVMTHFTQPAASPESLLASERPRSFALAAGYRCESVDDGTRLPVTASMYVPLSLWRHNRTYTGVHRRTRPYIVIHGRSFPMIILQRPSNDVRSPGDGRRCRWRAAGDGGGGGGRSGSEGERRQRRAI